MTTAASTLHVPLLNDRRTWFSSEAFSCERKTLLRCHVPTIPLAQEKAWRVSRAVMHCCQTLKKKVDKRFPCLNVPLKASWQPDYYQVIIRSLDVLVPCCVSVRRVSSTHIVAYNLVPVYRALAKRSPMNIPLERFFFTKK